jgi:hypothetical protein
MPTGPGLFGKSEHYFGILFDTRCFVAHFNGICMNDDGANINDAEPMDIRQ